MPLDASAWFRADRAATDELGWAYNLAVFRIVFLVAGALPTLLSCWFWARSSMPGLDAELWLPIAFYRFVPASVLLNAPLAQALAALAIGLVVLGALGIRTRAVLALATVATLYVLGLPQNQGKVHHFHNVVWFMALLAAGPSGHVLSADAWWRRGHPIPPLAGAFQTLAYVWGLLALIYLLPGIGKLVESIDGQWASAEQQRRLLWNKWIQLEWYEPFVRSVVRPDLAPDWVLVAGALATIVFEIGFFALVLPRRTRPIATVVGLGFHLLTGVALGIYFRWLVPAYSGLVDWARLAGRRAPEAAGRLASRAPSSRMSAPWLVHMVGGGLLMAEAAVGAAGLAEEHDWRARRMLLGIRPWPFDAYQVFTSDSALTFATWELRIQQRDGAEAAVDPAVFASAFWRASATQVLFRRAAQEDDPERRRRLSRALAWAVWRHLPEETRRNTRSLRAYISRWRAGPPPAELLGRELLEELPAPPRMARAGGG